MDDGIWRGIRCPIGRRGDARGSNTTWRNHRAYVSAVRDAATVFYKLGLISQAQMKAYVDEAQASSCGT
jgi:hypothetical protein